MISFYSLNYDLGLTLTNNNISLKSSNIGLTTFLCKQGYAKTIKVAT